MLGLLSLVSVSTNHQVPCIGNYSSWRTLGGNDCTAYETTYRDFCQYDSDRTNQTLTARLVCPECGDCTLPPTASPTASPTLMSPTASPTLSPTMSPTLPPTIWGSNEASPNPNHGLNEGHIYNGTFVPNQTSCMDVWETAGVGGMFSWGRGYDISYFACVNSSGYNYGYTFNVGSPWWYPNEQYPMLSPGECPTFALPNSCRNATDPNSIFYQPGDQCVRFSVALPDYTNCDEYLEYMSGARPNYVTNGWEDLCDPTSFGDIGDPIRIGFFLRLPGRITEASLRNGIALYNVREFCSQCQSTSHGGCVAGPPFRPNPPPTTPSPTPSPTPPPQPPTPAPTYTLPPTQVQKISVLEREATISDILVDERTITSSFEIPYSSINHTEFAMTYINTLRAFRSFAYEYVQIFPVSRSSRRRDNHDDITGTILLISQLSASVVPLLESRVDFGIVNVQGVSAQPLAITATLPPSPIDQGGDGEDNGDENNTVIYGAVGGAVVLLGVAVGLYFGCKSRTTPPDDFYSYDFYE